MDIPKLAAARDCDPEASMASYFAAVGPHDKETGRDLSTLVSTMFQRTIESAWPSMLALGRLLKSGNRLHSRDWAFSTADTGNPWHVAFVAEDNAGCGLLYVCGLEKERTQAATAREARRLEEARMIEDVAERRAAIARILVGSILVEDGSAAAEADYKAPSDVSSLDGVKVYAYRGSESPGFYDGFSTRLPELLSKAGKGNYVQGVIAECRPTKDRYGMEPSGSVERCSQTAAVLSAMDTLYSGLDAAGLMKDVHARAKAVSDWQYPNFGSEANGHVTEAGQAAVYADSGFAGPTCFDVAWEFWKDTAETDLTRKINEIHEIIKMLRENGFVSYDFRYACNDMDDFAHVVMDSSRGFGTLWLETQNGRYAIRFRQDRDGLSHLVLARVEDGFGVTPIGIDENEPGFLGAFALSPFPADDGKRRMSSHMMGRFHDRTVRDVNNILLTLDSVHCCLKEDLRASMAP